MPSIVTWKASPNAERWLDLEANQGISFQNGRVVSINLFSNFTIGDVRLSFNRPDIENVTLGDRNHFYYRGVYLQNSFFVDGDLLCPASGVDIWKTKFFVRFVGMPTANFGYDNKMPWGKAFFYCRNFNPLAGL
ncbi:MAG: hypothetical protein IT321_21705 [Anaerolineae bacterium]|nr:hypothetical protein [Anaerolineae bacterium]